MTNIGQTSESSVRDEVPIESNDCPVPLLYDLTDERNLTCIRLGRLINEFRFRMEALWVQVVDDISFASSSMPWEKLRTRLRELTSNEVTQLEIDRFVDAMRASWRDSFHAEWHHDLVCEANQMAFDPRNYGFNSTEQLVRAVLARVELPTEQIEQFVIATAGPRSRLIQLGKLLGQFDYPKPTERFLTYPTEPATSVGSGLILQSTESRPYEWRLPTSTLRSRTQSENADLTEQLESELNALGIAMTGAEFRRAHPNDGKGYLGLEFDGCRVYRNGQGELILQRQMFLLLQEFASESGGPITPETLLNRWRSFVQNPQEEYKPPELKSIRDTINDTSKAIRPLELKIIVPNRGMGYVLLDINDDGR